MTHLNSRWGQLSASNPSPDLMRAALAELQQTDDEHPDCWLSDESGWTVSVFQNGWVIFENDEADGEPQHMKLHSPDEALGLWQLLAMGDLSSLRSKQWEAGYPKN